MPAGGQAPSPQPPAPAPAPPAHLRLARQRLALGLVEEEHGRGAGAQLAGEGEVEAVRAACHDRLPPGRAQVAQRGGQPRCPGSLCVRRPGVNHDLRGVGGWAVRRKEVGGGRLTEPARGQAKPQHVGGRAGAAASAARAACRRGRGPAGAEDCARSVAPPHLEARAARDATALNHGGQLVGVAHQPLVKVGAVALAQAWVWLVGVCGCVEGRGGAGAGAGAGVEQGRGQGARG